MMKYFSLSGNKIQFVERQRKFLLLFSLYANKLIQYLILINLDLFDKFFLRKKIVHEILKINSPQKNISEICKRLTNRVIELDKKVQFCFIKIFRGVATKFEFYLPYLCLEDFCLPSSQNFEHFKLVYLQNIYSDSRNSITTNYLNEILLNKFFITKVQHEHTCSKIISRIYSRSEEKLFWRAFPSSSFQTCRELSDYLCSIKFPVSCSFAQ